jgi:alpha-N-arabinofuranosidase
MLPVRMPASKDLAVSCVRDSDTGDVILKLVSRADRPVELTLEVSSLGALSGTAACIVINGDPMSENLEDQPPVVRPTQTQLAVRSSMAYIAPPFSFTVLRIHTKAKVREES